MFILVEVRNREIDFSRIYDDSELELAKQDLKNDLHDYTKSFNLVEGVDWGVEYDGMEGWANTPCNEIDMSIMWVQETR